MVCIGLQDVSQHDQGKGHDYDSREDDRGENRSPERELIKGGELAHNDHVYLYTTTLTSRLCATITFFGVPPSR